MIIETFPLFTFSYLKKYILKIWFSNFTLVTFYYAIHNDRGKCTPVISSLYPGVDVLNVPGHVLLLRPGEQVFNGSYSFAVVVS